jgi:putative IMPACT (imprinted ancient) family translation regulator
MQHHEPPESELRLSRLQHHCMQISHIYKNRPLDREESGPIASPCFHPLHGSNYDNVTLSFTNQQKLKWWLLGNYTLLNSHNRNVSKTETNNLVTGNRLSGPMKGRSIGLTQKQQQLSIKHT